MLVNYHGMLLKVIEFKNGLAGEYWIDLGLGYWVNADHVEIVSDDTFHK